MIELRTVDALRVIARLLAMWFLIVTAAQTRVESGQTNQPDNRRLAQFHSKRRQLLTSLRRDLSGLSEECHLRGQSDLATDLTSISLDLTSPTGQRPLPLYVGLPVSRNLPEDERIVRNRLRNLRSEKARELYTLARLALREARLPSIAYLLIQDVLRVDPDHKLARAVIGEQLFKDPARRNDSAYAGEWVSPFEIAQRTGTSPEVDHPEFGWIPVSHVRRYEEGLRPWGNSWVSREKEAELRRNFRNAWEIRTEHFRIKTNTSLEEGVQLSRRLEVYYDWLHHNFAAFFETPRELQRRFEVAQVSRSRVARLRPMDIDYFATRSEYQERTRGKIPPNIPTNGLYWEPDRTCYLFRNPEDPSLSTAFHEATHQIFDLATREHRVMAARKLQRMLGHRSTGEWILCRNSNFWVLEGIACYMESFEVNDGLPSAGNPRNIRFVGATQRLLLDDFYIDLRTFSKMGKDAYRQHPNHTQLYTQGSGVAHFLLHYNDGVYRDAFVELLSRVYQPDMNDLKTDPSLEELTGVEFGVLDFEYRQHLANLINQQ